jgi:pimeloyl-ACP methyl ester carboxylesterase
MRNIIPGQVIALVLLRNINRKSTGFIRTQNLSLKLGINFPGHLPLANTTMAEVAALRDTDDADPAVPHACSAHLERYEGLMLHAAAQCLSNLCQFFGSDRVALGLSLLRAHYFKHQIFLADNFLLAHVGKIRHIPTTIVQGRYDAVCPIVSADDLVRVTSGKRIITSSMTPDTPHSSRAFRAKLIEELWNSSSSALHKILQWPERASLTSNRAGTHEKKFLKAVRR